MVKLLAFVILGVAYFNMGAEYEHLKKSSEALWHYQRVWFSDVSAAARLQVAVISVPWEFPNNTEARDSCLQELGEEFWPWTSLDPQYHPSSWKPSSSPIQSNMWGCLFCFIFEASPQQANPSLCGSTHTEVRINSQRAFGWCVNPIVDGSKNPPGRSRRRSQPKCFTSGSLRSWYRNIRGNKQMVFVEFLELLASVASLVSIVSRFWAGLEMIRIRSNDREKLHVCRESSSTKS